MTKEELEQFEKKLEENGYKKYTSCLSSNEAWGWFKSYKENKPDEWGEYRVKYMIEFRVWDYTKYEQCPDDYSIDRLILDGGSHHRIDLEITEPRFDIETTEVVAKKLHNMLKPFVNKEYTL